MAARAPTPRPPTPPHLRPPPPPLYIPTPLFLHLVRAARKPPGAMPPDIMVVDYRDSLADLGGDGVARALEMQCNVYERGMEELFQLENLPALPTRGRMRARAFRPQMTSI
ncbi:PREDICTED: uncharacterized protein LOC106751210 [Dinoponera quadriceps]|uniref:Uncharacterized protein LOC106751210 n=1 Tax=Dinoponera quadriceps TaxID=609295 RepID=A0A6P3YB03_DINQU|nr:PREDICTED: uncharacterized protein LOC106751210 [Dinoponera quadriceps]